MGQDLVPTLPQLCCFLRFLRGHPPPPPPYLLISVLGLASVEEECIHRSILLRNHMQSSDIILSLYAHGPPSNNMAQQDTKAALRSSLVSHLGRKVAIPLSRRSQQSARKVHTSCSTRRPPLAHARRVSGATSRVCSGILCCAAVLSCSRCTAGASEWLRGPCLPPVSCL